MGHRRILSSEMGWFINIPALLLSEIPIYDGLKHSLAILKLCAIQVSCLTFPHFRDLWLIHCHVQVSLSSQWATAPETLPPQLSFMIPRTGNFIPAGIAWKDTYTNYTTAHHLSQCNEKVDTDFMWPLLLFYVLQKYDLRK